VKVRDVLKTLETDGWVIVRTKGHPTKLGTVTVSGKPSVDVPIGTLKSIWKQAQIEE
jgi:predicted RNA binding protein YcfA (HicA-like mRNA interferase family)